MKRPVLFQVDVFLIRYYTGDIDLYEPFINILEYVMHQYEQVMEMQVIKKKINKLKLKYFFRNKIYNRVYNIVNKMSKDYVFVMSLQFFNEKEGKKYACIYHRLDEVRLGWVFHSVFIFFIIYCTFFSFFRLSGLVLAKRSSNLDSEGHNAPRIKTIWDGNLL